MITKPGLMMKQQSDQERRVVAGNRIRPSIRPSILLAQESPGELWRVVAGVVLIRLLIEIGVGAVTTLRRVLR